MIDSPLALYSIVDIIKELQSRNLSFLFAWVDHLQFNKDVGQAEEIVWGIDHGGNHVLQETLLRFLNEHYKGLLAQKTAPGLGSDG